MVPIIPRPSRMPSAGVRYGGALVACTVATAVILVLPRALWLTSGALIYLIAVLAVAALWDRGPAILASVVSFGALDFIFIEPRFTLSISSADEWVALVAYLVVAVVTSQLAAGQRERYLDAEGREHEARLLHDLTDLLAATPFSTALAGACERLRAELDAKAVVIAVDIDEVRTRAAAGDPDAIDATTAITGPQAVLGEDGRPRPNDPGGPGAGCGSRRRTGRLAQSPRCVWHERPSAAATTNSAPSESAGPGTDAPVPAKPGSSTPSPASWRSRSSASGSVPRRPRPKRCGVRAS